MILRALRRRGEMHVGALAEMLRLPFKTASRNLLLLERAGLVSSEPRGVYVYYRMNPDVERFVMTVIDAMADAHDPAKAP